MKVLILIFASKKEPYPELIRAAQKTWDSAPHPNVPTLFFYGGDAEHAFGNVRVLNVSDEYNMQHVKYKRVLDYVWDWEWDFILRGSLSSYFDKQLVYEKALKLPKEKCYMGRPQYFDHITTGVGNWSGEYASGCAQFQSRDVVSILRKELPETPHQYEDVLTGQILQKFGIGVTPGYEMNNFYPDKKLSRVYHHRCRNESGESRRDDMDAFETIFKYLNNGA